MTRARRDVAAGGERSGRWQIERRGERLMRMVGETGTTTGIGNVEDLAVLTPNLLEDAKIMMRNLEAREIAHHGEIVKTETFDHQEKALHRR
jgi:hypothetical protein